MNCPICNGGTKVIDTLSEYDNVLRCRKCAKCGKVIYTIEIQSFDENDRKRLNYAHGKKRTR